MHGSSRYTYVKCLPFGRFFWWAAKAQFLHTWGDPGINTHWIGMHDSVPVLVSKWLSHLKSCDWVGCVFPLHSEQVVSLSIDVFFSEYSKNNWPKESKWGKLIQKCKTIKMSHWETKQVQKNNKPKPPKAIGSAKECKTNTHEPLCEQDVCIDLICFNL